MSCECLQPSVCGDALRLRQPPLRHHRRLRPLGRHGPLRLCIVRLRPAQQLEVQRVPVQLARLACSLPPASACTWRAGSRQTSLEATCTSMLLGAIKHVHQICRVRSRVRVLAGAWCSTAWGPGSALGAGKMQRHRAPTWAGCWRSSRWVGAPPLCQSWGPRRRLHDTSTWAGLISTSI